MLRGINVGGHHIIKMDALRKLYESLGLRNPRTFIQSGNVVFETDEKNEALLAKRIEDEIERLYKFRPLAIQRTVAELKKATEQNPFAGRSGIEPEKLHVIFLAKDPNLEVQFNADPEEVQIRGREMYIFFPDGMGRSKLRIPTLEKALQTQGTARNWNTVNKLLELAQTES